MEITDFTINGKCSDCGQCCSNVLPLTKNEVNRIKEYMRQHPIKEQHNNVISGKLDLSCPFRDERNRKCLIYEVCPAICREFMCNHTIEDIRKSKLDLHENHDVVYMRGKFFGHDATEEALKSFLFDAKEELLKEK